MGKPGILTMFLGAVLIALVLLIDLNISFNTWLILFLISVAVAVIGTIMSIVELAKKIKEEQKSICLHLISHINQH